MEGISKDARYILKKLTEFNGSVYFLVSMQKAYIRNWKGSKHPPNIPKLNFIHGSRLAVRHPISKELYIPDLSFIVTNTNLEKKVADIIRMFTNNLVGLSYEILETYLYDIAAELCIKNKVNALKINKMIHCANQKAFRQHLKSNWKQTGELYKQVIKKLLPTLSAKTITNKKLEIFFETLIEARHVITHTEGRIIPAKVLNVDQRDYLKSFFGVEVNKRVWQINTSNHAPFIFQAIMQFVLLIEEAKKN